MKKIYFWLLLVCSILYCGNLSYAQIPAVSNLVLQATSPDNLTIDSLICTYNVTASVVETATAWYKNDSPEMLLYMPFEAGFTNALRDFSGNNNNATTNDVPTNSPVWDNNGGHNGSGAFIFDGNDYLLAGDIFPLNSSYTKTAWVYLTSYDFTNIISSILHAANNHFFKVHTDGRLNAGHNTGAWDVIDDTPLNLNTWYFVAVTFNYNTGDIILYKNGIEVKRGVVPVEYRSIIDPSVLVGAMNYQLNKSLHYIMAMILLCRKKQLGSMNGMQMLRHSQELK